MNNKRIIVLNNLLSDIEKSIPFKNEKKLSVSNATVGWQLDHALKVINSVCSTLTKTDPKNYKRNFNITRMILFSLCYIPRGKAKSPKTVLPPSNISEVDLLTQLQEAKNHINNIHNIHEKAYFKHFIFGMLSKQKTMRFLEMHTKHHLKIVKDILK